MEQTLLKQAWQLNKRGFKLWYQHFPQIFWASSSYRLIANLLPYVTLFLSATIINELAGRKDTERLQQLVVTVLIVDVALGLLQAILLHWKTICEEQLYQKGHQLYVEKFLKMDFVSVDDASVRDNYHQVNQNEIWMGNGIPQVVGYFDDACEAIFGALGAVFLTIGLFTSQVPQTAGKWTLLNNKSTILVLFILLVASVWGSAALSGKSDSYLLGLSDLMKESNRLFNFFGVSMNESKRALDVRTFRQDKLTASHWVGKGSVIENNAASVKYFRGPLSIFLTLANIVATLFIGVVYVFVCLKAWAGAFGVGSVTQYIGAITKLSQSVTKLFSLTGRIKGNAPFLQVAFDFLDTPNDMYQGSLTTEKRSDRKYEIEFRDVSFRYPHAENYALRHVSMKFNIGERLAVVGENGSGKTTFIKLLCRLYDPTEGEILLNGINIRKYDYQDYLQLFSVVFQDFALFSFSLGQNVAAAVAYDAKKVEQCLEEAGFSGRLAKSENKLATNLYKDFDPSGVEISGGEAQKIAIARALYKDAPFIILDEPTAALDPIAEQEVYSKFDSIVGDKTAVYISHRLSSCRFCDEILVFDEGAVVEQGNHTSLVQNLDGKYHELWHAQAQYYQ